MERTPPSDASEPKQEIPQSEPLLTRREVVVGGGLVAGAAALFWKYHDKLVPQQKISGVQKEDSPGAFNERLLPPPFVDIPDLESLTPDESWSAERLQVTFENAVQQSLAERRTVEVNLALDDETSEEIDQERLIVLDREVITVVPEGASISIRGNKKVRIQLAEELSDIPDEWDTPQKHNAVEFTDVEGELFIDGITFDGGSQRAGKEGYPPPGGPWDAVLYINGTGPGSGKKPEREPLQNSRKGRAEITNCGFYNTESAACYVKNLSSVKMENCEGKNFDAIYCISWCDNFEGQNIRAQNSLSDGIAAYCCDSGILSNVQVKTARQGILLQGCQNVDVRDCYVEDCGKGYDLYQFKESDTITYPIKDITITNSDSRDCAMVYAFGRSTDVVVRDGTHDTVGQWYERDDFLHDEIARPEEFDRLREPLWVQKFEDVSFQNIQLRKSQQTGKNYGIPSFYEDVGIRTYGFS